MYYFCTLFDRNYLFKGLSLYNSLLKHCPAFVLHILCMDSLTLDVLAKLHLTNARLISLEDFEDAALKAVKPSRSTAEYCWTCTPSLLLYVLTVNPEIDLVTYLDADLLFFRDPYPVFAEFGTNSIMLIEHRFPENLRYLEVNGKYNVQMMCFRRDPYGVECLSWWRARCLESCYNRLEDGKLGDQKYLDDWPTRFKGVHVLRHLGAGVAPWNISQYDATEQEGQIWINEYPLIFYHFHQFQILQNHQYSFASALYAHKKALPMPIYRRYIEQIEASMSMVHAAAPEFSFGITKASVARLRHLAGRYLPRAVKNFLKSIKP